MKKLVNLGIIPINYGVLESLLKDYSSPQNKIVELEKKGDLIRLKRGMYVVSNSISRIIVSGEVVFQCFFRVD